MGFYSPLFLIDNIKILVAFGVCGFSSTWKICIFDIYLAFVASNFRNNSLSSLPTEIGVLSRLGNLDLHSNQVTFLYVKLILFHMKTKKKKYKICLEIYIFKFNIPINTIKQHEVVYPNTII